LRTTLGSSVCRSRSGVRPAEDLFSFSLDFIRFLAVEQGTRDFFGVGTPIKNNEVARVLSACQPDSRYPAP
jgi:hypothetical protein